MKKPVTKAIALLLSSIMCVLSIHVSAYAEGNTEYVEETTEVNEVETVVISETTELVEETETSEQEVIQETESVYENDSYKVIFSLTSQWDGGYNASVKIENTSESTIENWCV